MTGSFVPSWRKEIEKGERRGRSKANSKCLNLLGTLFVGLFFCFFANVQMKMLEPRVVFWVIIDMVVSHTGFFLRPPTSSIELSGGIIQNLQEIDRVMKRERID